MTDPALDPQPTNFHAQTRPGANDSEYRSGKSAGHSSSASVIPNNHLTLRCLIAARDAGIVIGKGGQNVQDIREATDARIRVSEHVPGASERILSLNGTPESVSAAVEMVMQKLLAVSETAAQDQHTFQQRRFPINRNMLQVRMLVPHVQMGAIIGKGGSHIREIQESAHCRIVASEQLLPNSTDRCVTVSGDSAQIQQGVYFVAQTLLDNSHGPDDSRMQGHVAFRPTARNPRFDGADGARRMGSNGHYERGPRHFDGSIQQVADTGMEISQEIRVPNSFVGALIGKGGARIREIRDKSGSQIRIAEPDGSNERLVSVLGTSRSNQTALMMIYARLETEKNRMLSQGDAMDQSGIPLDQVDVQANA